MNKEAQECYISKDLLSEFSDYLNKNMGLFYPQSAWAEFEKKIPQISSSFGFQDQSECIKWIIDQPVTKDLITALAEHLTIGETYFFRDKNTFDLLEKKILEPLIAERSLENQKQLKIWSAACCTGEEPYTIAMILNEIIPNIKNWNISILGSDINIEFLRRAKRGLYRDWALRAIPKKYFEKYFSKESGGYAISPNIKKMVRFSYLNLIEDQYPSLTNGTNNVDLVLCNNVLIYFSESQSRRVITQLDKSLVDGGHLCVTPIEASYVNSPTLNIRSDVSVNIFRSNKIAEFTKKKNPNKILNDVSKDFQQDTTSIRKKSSFFENFLNQKSEKDTQPKSLSSQTPKNETIDEPTLLKNLNVIAQSGDYQSVVQKIEQYFVDSNTAKHHHSELVKFLIKAHVNIGNLDQAKDLCEEYLSVDKTNASMHYLHAAIYQEFNGMEEALNSLRKAIFLNSDFTIAYFTMGNILLSQDELYEARKHFRNTLISLDKLEGESIVPETDELTAGRLKEIVENILTKL